MLPWPESSPPHSHPASQVGEGGGTVVDAERLLQQLFRTDPRQATALLYRQYYRELCSHVIRYVYARPVAEDIVGEVFYQFLQTEAYTRITTSYRAYLYRAVRNRAVNHLYQRDGQPQSLEGLLAEPADASPQQPDQLLQLDELRQRIETAVRSLPPQCQRVFVLSRVEGKPQAEIADELGVSIKAVEYHITRALQRLRLVLRQPLLWLAVGTDLFHVLP
jgi:RNA polymerase sigma-70 factor (family 1)